MSNDEQIAWQEALATAARTLGDRCSEGVALGNLGLAYAALGEVPKAIDHYQQQLVMAQAQNPAVFSSTEAD